MANENDRLLLHEMLTAFQEAVGEEPHAYFQPPESVKMQYPCFVYHLANDETVHADDKPYLYREVYDVTYITRESEPVLPEAMKGLPNTRFSRRYTAENLNHFAFTVSGSMLWSPSRELLDSVNKRFIGGN